MSIKHLSTTRCCSHEFTKQDIIAPLLTAKQALGTNERLYGGNAKWFARGKCPECSREYMLWLMPVPRGYKVLTISEIEGQGQEQEQEQDDESISVETATKEQLRAFLRQRGVSFFNGASEEQLRELVTATLVTA